MDLLTSNGNRPIRFLSSYDSIINLGLDNYLNGIGI